MDVKLYFSEVLGGLGNENKTEVSRRSNGVDIARSTHRRRNWTCSLWNIEHSGFCY